MNNNTHNEQNNDNKISSLYKQGSIETPAKHINETILQQARLGSNNVIPLSIKRIFTTITSSTSLAVAAVLIIGVSVVLQIQFDHFDEIIPASIETYSDEQILLENSNTDNTDILLSTPAQTSETVNDNEEKNTPHGNINSTPKKSAPKPLMKAYKPTAKSEPEAKAVYERQRLEHYLKQKHKTDREQRLERKSPDKEEILKNRIESTPTAAQGISSLSSDLENCNNFNNTECLTSKSCTLNISNNKLNCQKAANHCELDFSQLHDSIESCHKKEQCEYTTSTCQCDLNGLCECEDNTPPACLLMNDDVE